MFPFSTVSIVKKEFFVAIELENLYYGISKLVIPWKKCLQLFSYTHAKFEELNALLTGQVCCLNMAT